MKKIIAINCSPRSTWTMFIPEYKKKRHETVFPEDKKKAFALGELMITGAWAEVFL